MSGEWIKVEVTLPNKPEVIRIGRALGLSADAVCGVLIRFWGWASANSVDGFVTQLALRDIDMIVTLPGFADAMVSVGWLRHDVDFDRICLPNFTRHNGESAKKRALTAKRQERYRDANSVTKVTQQALPEKRREEKNLKPDAGASDPVKEEIWKTGKALLVKGGFDVKAAGGFLGKLCKEYGQILVLQAVRDCVSNTPAEPHTWLVARCQERRKGNGSTTAGPAWWASNEGIQAKAAELGIQPRKGEGWNDLKARVSAKLEAH